MQRVSNFYVRLLDSLIAIDSYCCSSACGIELWTFYMCLRFILTFEIECLTEILLLKRRIRQGPTR